MKVSRSLRALAVFAIAFGVITVISGGRTLLDPAVRRAAEPVVPFVLDFNFFAGFVYIAAGLGLWSARRWAAFLALLLALATLAVFGAFGVHVLGGSAFAERTVFAMLFRSATWCAIAFVSCHEVGCRSADAGQSPNPAP
ncbi:MAG: hypothetical protein IPI67_23150 [Myxococcales bacterium]|nr:hypothetical protein [Myxococcales bacterium]